MYNIGSISHIALTILWFDAEHTSLTFLISVRRVPVSYP